MLRQLDFTKKLIERSRVYHNHKPQPTLDTKRKKKRTKTTTTTTKKTTTKKKKLKKKKKNIHALNEQTNVRAVRGTASTSISEVIRMLKQTEK